MTSKYTSHITKGSYIALAYILLNTLLFYSKSKGGLIIDFVAWVLIIGGTFLSVQFFSKFSEDKKTFGNLFAHGFKTTAVATCFIFIYMWAMIYVIDKGKSIDMVNDMISQAKKANPSAINEKQLQEGMPNAIKVARIGLLAGGVMFTLFLGLVGSVLGAVFSNKHNSN